jgi:hypothetical protein
MTNSRNINPTRTRERLVSIPASSVPRVVPRR